MIRRYTVSILILLVVLLSSRFYVNAAGEGIVNSILVTGGENPGDTITVDIEVAALDKKINNSNFYIQILDPSNSRVDEHSHILPTLEESEVYSYTWNTDNSSYPEAGTYTVSLCWSPGNSSQNCTITDGTPTTATFYSVPTLEGVWLLIGAGMLVTWMLWLRKTQNRATQSQTV